MDQSQPEAATPEPAADVAHILVTVVRTGGIAGMRRQWQVEPPPVEAPRWIAMIDECPWDDDLSGSAGADRFVWRILVQRDDHRPREAELPDSRLDGPWRVLVDRVRETAKPRSAAEK